jgi:hypothetical protein
MAFGVVLFLVGTATLLGGCGMAATAVADGTDSEDFAKVKLFTQKAALGMVVVAFLGSVVPSRNAIMMMAAANYGDEIYKSDLKEIVDPAKELLKKWVNEQLQEKKK